jgi:hypothetical protein
MPKQNVAIYHGKEGMIFSNADIQARMGTGATLTNDNASG